MNETAASSQRDTQILIAEDSPTQSVLLQHVLEKNGFRVTAAANGRLALEALAHCQPTLIISDIQMPEMDGYELCRRLKADAAWREIPVILLTSLSAPHDIIRGLECGADNFVVKPFEEEFLMARIRSVLANRALSQPENGSGIAIEFAGERFVIESSRRQTLNLLLSTYETAVKTHRELLETHELLKATQAQLIEAEKLESIGRLAAGVAHEVRNPLAIIEMGASFLAGQPIDETGHSILQEISTAVSRTNAIVTRLSEFTASPQLGMREENLHDIIERALAVLAAEIDRRGIMVDKGFADGLPAARLDAAKIEQLFTNIFSNALDTMPNGGTLTIQTGLRTLTTADVAFDAGGRAGTQFRAGDAVIHIEVRDTGGGIEPDRLGKLFDPFYTTKPTGRGMGLGLTVAKKIIDLHGGKISIANGADGGAVVSLDFRPA